MYDYSDINNIDNLIIDFDLSIENVISETTIRFCLFHYSRAVYRKLKALGLSKLYREGKKIRFLLNVYFALYSLWKKKGKNFLTDCKGKQVFVWSEKCRRFFKSLL